MTPLMLLLRRVSPAVYSLMVGLLGAAMLIGWHIHTVNRAYDRGRADVTRELGAVAPLYKDRVVQLAGKTNTTIRYLRDTLYRTDTLIKLVPESIRVANPSVDAALASCSALVRTCDQLRQDIVVERAARDSLSTALSAATVAKADTIRHLSSRPTRLRAAVWALIVGGVGFVAGSR